MSDSKVFNIFEKNKSRITAFLYDFVLVTIFYGGLLRKSYNADTITYMVYPMDSADERLRGGRYIIMLFDYLFAKAGIRTTDYYYICIFLSMALLAACIAIIQHVFIRFIKSENLLVILGYNLAVGLAFCNVLFIEYFMFVEMTIFMLLGFFFATLGVLYYTEKKYVVSIVSFGMAVCLYQMVLPYAAITLVFYYMLSNDFTWSKKAVLDEMFAAAAPMCLAAADLVAIKIVGKLSEEHTFGYEFAHSGGASTFNSKMSDLIHVFIMYFDDSYTLLPGRFIPGIVLILSFALAVFLLYKLKGGLSVLYYLVAVLVSLTLIFIVPLMEDVFFFPPRMSYLLYVLQGLMLITIISLLTATDNEVLVKTVSYVTMGFMWIQMISCFFIVSGRYVANTLDITYCKTIIREIEKYEEENNVTVTKLSATTDAYAPRFYDESKVHYEQINERIIGQTTRSAFEAWFGRHFDDAEGIPVEIYDEFFADKDWDYFDANEQLIIRGDTAYLCVY